MEHKQPTNTKTRHAIRRSTTYVVAVVVDDVDGVVVVEDDRRMLRFGHHNDEKKSSEIVGKVWRSGERSLSVRSVRSAMGRDVIYVTSYSLNRRDSRPRDTKHNSISERITDVLLMRSTCY